MITIDTLILGTELPWSLETIHLGQAGGAVRPTVGGPVAQVVAVTADYGGPTSSTQATL